MEEKLTAIDSLATKEAYADHDREFITTFTEGNLDRAKEIISQFEIRTLPYTQNYNYENRVQELYYLGQ